MLRKIMEKDFIGVDYNDVEIVNTLPKHDEILSSLVCRAFLKIVKHGYGKTTTQKFWWNPKIFLSKYGFMYSNKSEVLVFKYWDESLSISKKRVATDKIKFNIDKVLKGVYPTEIFLVLKSNFGSYCQILRNEFNSYSSNINAYTKNVETIKEKINNNGLDEFIKDFETLTFMLRDKFISKKLRKMNDKNLTLYYQDLNQQKELKGKALEAIIKKPLEIIDNAMSVVSDEDKKKLLYLLADIIPMMGNDLETKKIYETLLEVISLEDERRRILDLLGKTHLRLENYREAIETYNKILSIFPNDETVKKEIVKIEHLENFYSIPEKDRNKAEKLYSKSLKLSSKNKDEGALECSIEAYKLNPYYIKNKNQIVSILKKLGRQDELNNILSSNI